jgi:hypothetical protein
VDLLCAVVELRALGVDISRERELQLRGTVDSRAATRKKKRAAANRWAADPDSDENFAYIAGYTPGGAPFGLTWEEQEEIERRGAGDPESRPAAL